jgi:hypothetical protein
MSLPASVCDVLANHVTLEVECSDRMYLNLYQPRLVYPGGVVGFFRTHRGMPFVSGALMDPISKGFVVSIHRFIKDRGLDLVHCTKGQRKDDVANGCLARHDGTEGIPLRRPGSGEVQRLPHREAHQRADGQALPVDGDVVRDGEPVLLLRPRRRLRAFFFKFGTYFPCTARVCRNGHHFAQRQAAEEGSASNPSTTAS